MFLVEMMIENKLSFAIKQSESASLFSRRSHFRNLRSFKSPIGSKSRMTNISSRSTLSNGRTKIIMSSSRRNDNVRRRDGNIRRKPAHLSDNDETKLRSMQHHRILSTASRSRLSPISTKQREEIVIGDGSFLQPTIVLGQHAFLSPTSTFAATAGISPIANACFTHSLFLTSATTISVAPSPPSICSSSWRSVGQQPTPNVSVLPTPITNRIFVDGIAYEIIFVGDVSVIERNGLPHRIGFSGLYRDIVIDGFAHSLVFDNQIMVMIGARTYGLRFGAPSRELYIDAYPIHVAFGGTAVLITLDGAVHEIRLSGPTPKIAIDPEPDYELLREISARINPPVNVAEVSLSSSGTTFETMFTATSGNCEGSLVDDATMIDNLLKSLEERGFIKRD